MKESVEEKLRKRMADSITLHPLNDWPDASVNIVGMIKLQYKEKDLSMEKAKFLLGEFNKHASQIGKSITWEQCLSGDY